MSKALRVIDSSLSELKITPEETRVYFIVYRSYTKSKSLEPKKILLSALEDREHFGFGIPVSHDYLDIEHKQRIRDIESRYEPDTQGLTLTQTHLIRLLRENGFIKGRSLFRESRSERSWYKIKQELAEKNIRLEDADKWQLKYKEIQSEIDCVRKNHKKQTTLVNDARNNCDSWHELAAHIILNEKGGWILVAFIYNGKIYHKAYIKVSRYKITNQGFSGPETEYTGEGPRNIVFYP